MSVRRAGRSLLKVERLDRVRYNFTTSDKNLADHPIDCLRSRSYRLI